MLLPCLCCFRFLGLLLLGNLTKASYLSTSGNGMSLVAKERVMVDTYSFRMNGNNGASPNIYFSKRVLDYLDDEYGGVVINPENLPSNPSVFASVLRSSLSRWMLMVISIFCFISTFGL